MHYFENTSKKLDLNKLETIKYNILDEEIYFKTSENVFSKKNIDRGTDILNNFLISTQDINNKKVLDIGCGYGAIGITLAKFFNKASVIMTDITTQAKELAVINVEKNNLNKQVEVVCGNLYQNIIGKFDLIVSNPPIRAGKTVINDLIQGSKEALSKNGKLILVIRKKQGMKSFKEYMNKAYGNSEIYKREYGYYIIGAVKNNS